MGYIYRITNSVNNKVYIGQTINDPEKRWKDHKKNVKELSINRPLVDAMRVLGIDKFRMDIIIICFDDSMDDIEIEQIKRYSSLHPNGYNYTEGGHFHKKPSEELRKKLSMIGKKRFEREGERERNKERQRLAFSNPELCLKMSTVRVKLLNSEAGTKWRKGHSERINAFYETEEGQKAKKKASEKKLEFLESEEGIQLREEHSAKLIARNLTPEGKASIEKMRETKKAFFATSEGKEMIKLIQAKRKETIEAKKKLETPKVYRCDLCDYSAPDNGKLKRHNESKRHNDKLCSETSNTVIYPDI